MTRDRTARTRIRQFLASSGPVADPSGYATGVLKDLVGYEGSPVAFIQLIAAMERDGEIVRNIRGKRTYDIQASPETIAAQRELPPLAQNSNTQAVQLDYDALARAIVRELWASTADRLAGVAPLAAEPVSAQRDDYARRLEAARKQIDALLADADQMTSQHSV